MDAIQLTLAVRPRTFLLSDLHLIISKPLVNIYRHGRVTKRKRGQCGRGLVEIAETNQTRRARIAYYAAVQDVPR